MAEVVGIKIAELQYVPSTDFVDADRIVIDRINNLPGEETTKHSTLLDLRNYIKSSSSGTTGLEGLLEDLEDVLIEDIQPGDFIIRDENNLWVNKSFEENISTLLENGDITLDASITREIEVNVGANGQVGGYKTGDVILEGTLFTDFIEKLVTKSVFDDAIAPTLNISNDRGNVELGSSIGNSGNAVGLSINYTSNDAGPVLSGLIQRSYNGNTDSLTSFSNSIPTAYTDSDSLILNTVGQDVTYTVSVTYDQGDPVVDQFGNPIDPNDEPTAIIQGDTITKTTSFTVLPRYWSIKTNSQLDGSALTRNSAILQNSDNDKGLLSSGTITINGDGSNNVIALLIPQTTIQKITSTEAGFTGTIYEDGANINSAYVISITTASINDAGGTPRTYTLLQVIGDTAYGGTLKITI